MVGDFQGLVHCQAEFCHQIEHARLAAVLGRGLPIEQDVVVGLGQSRVGLLFRDDPRDVGHLPQFAKLITFGHNRAAAVDAPIENALPAAPRSCHCYVAFSRRVRTDKDRKTHRAV